MDPIIEQIVPSMVPMCVDVFFPYQTASRSCRICSLFPVGSGTCLYLLSNLEFSIRPLKRRQTINIMSLPFFAVMVSLAYHQNRTSALVPLTVQFQVFGQSFGIR